MDKEAVVHIHHGILPSSPIILSIDCRSFSALKLKFTLILLHWLGLPIKCHKVHFSFIPYLKGNSSNS